MALVDAQQARRAVDRIVGYKLSPLLWRNVGPNLSAGRVQSAALLLVVEREREIRAFNAQEFWDITAKLATGCRRGLPCDAPDRREGEVLAPQRRRRRPSSSSGSGPALGS